MRRSSSGTFHSGGRTELINREILLIEKKLLFNSKKLKRELSARIREKLIKSIENLYCHHPVHCHSKSNLHITLCYLLLLLDIILISTTVKTTIQTLWKWWPTKWTRCSPVVGPMITTNLSSCLTEMMVMKWRSSRSKTIKRTEFQGEECGEI